MSKKNLSEASSSSELVHISSTIFLNRIPSFRRHTLAQKIDNLVEFTHLPKDARINSTELPLASPYSLYHRQRSLTISIWNIITRSSPPAKEILQSSSIP